MTDHLKTIRSALDQIAGNDWDNEYWARKTAQETLASLAALEQAMREPVAWMLTNGELTANTIEVAAHEHRGNEATPLFAAPPAQQAQPTEIELRKLLCVTYAGGAAYMDDGEAQDSRALPVIDFLRDTPSEIQKKMQQRSIKQAQPSESLESLLSTAIGILMGYSESSARNYYKPNSAIDNFVNECVERLKDWPFSEDTTKQAQPTDRDSKWFAVAMNAAAYLEGAAQCIRGDAEAKKAAEGAAKHVREQCNLLWSQRKQAQAEATILDGVSGCTAQDQERIDQAAKLLAGKQAQEVPRLTDDEIESICRMGAVYAPDGKVIRSPNEYRMELQDAARRAARKAEAALIAKMQGGKA